MGRALDGGLVSYAHRGFKAEGWAAKFNEKHVDHTAKDYNAGGLDIELHTAGGLTNRAYLIGENDNAQNADHEKLLSRQTFGIHSKALLGHFEYEIETARQIGTQETVDISAFMVSLEAAYTLPVTSKIRLAAGYDYLSGGDANDDKIKVFNTLLATNHARYGNIDYFTNIPVDTDGHGLQDFIFRAKAYLTHDLVGKADFHIFRYAQKDAAGEQALGKEVDINFYYHYNAHVDIVIGGYVFLPSEVFKRTRGDKNTFKAYTMFSVNF